MFINYSNHSSATWGRKQMAAALLYGQVCDVPFPQVGVDMTADEIKKLAERELKRLERTASKWGEALNDTTLMCQGEFSLTYAIVSRLKQRYPDCRVVCALSKREVIEETSGECTLKKVKFYFCGFREYL